VVKPSWGCLLPVTLAKVTLGYMQLMAKLVWKFLEHSLT
jgi:hypothetical protein